MKVAYLISRYPAVSHTFIQREIAELRRLDVEVITVSVHAVGDDEVLSPVDRQERARTRHLLPVGSDELAAAARVAVANPRATAAILGRSLTTAGVPWSRRLAYVVEALLLRRLLLDAGVRHIHAHFANVAADVARLTVHLGQLIDGGGWSWSFTMHGPTEFTDVRRFDLAGKVADADAVVCISDYCRSQLMALTDERHWHKLRVVHCGVDPTWFTPSAGSRPTDALRVLSVGRLVPEKGHTVLLDAVADLAGQGIDVDLTIVGDGPARAALEAHAARRGIADRVQFAGAVGADVITAHYEAADVFCLSSFAEGVPVVLMEAMACGLPVVTTRIAGIPELVDDGVSGYLVPAGRHDLVAKALALLAIEPELREKFGEAGREKVATEFDQGRSAAALAELLDELAAAR